MEDQDEDEEGEEGVVAKTPLLCCVIPCLRLLGNFLIHLTRTSARVFSLALLRSIEMLP